MKRHRLYLKKNQTALVGTRILSLLLATMLLLTCLSACGNNEQQTKANNSDDWSSDTTDEKKEQQSKDEGDIDFSPENTGDENEDESGANTSPDKDISVLSIKSYDEGSAVIEFAMDDATYYGIINAKGEIIYYSGNSIEMYYSYNSIESTIWTPTGNSCGFLTTKNDKYKDVFTIFNENGDIAMTVTEGGTFDEIIGYGDGLLLVYKDTSNITTNEYSYGVLSCNGDWVIPLQARFYLQDINYEQFRYFGDGIFIAHDRHDTRNHKFFNANTGLFFELVGCTIDEKKISNGVIYAEANSNSAYIKFASHFERVELPKYFTLSVDGEVKETSKFVQAHEDLLQGSEDGVIYFVDKSDINRKKYYDLYPSAKIISVEFDGDHGVIQLYGADKKSYFTIIDKDCNEIVEPICCSGMVYCSDSRIVFSSNGSMEVMDFNGNYIVDNSQGYTRISPYSGGIAKAEKGDEKFFIDLDGNPITIKLK